jgi:nitrogen fixation-related uncharacterized protein
VTFYLVVLGAFTVAMAALLAWAVRRGEFRDSEQAKFRVLELDRTTEVSTDE